MEECLICLNQIEYKIKSHYTCGHNSFHQECVDRWDGTCPKCRAKKIDRKVELVTIEGREWLKSNEGREWLKSKEGREWLWLKDAKEWLRSEDGEEWLRSDAGKEWLVFERGVSFFYTVRTFEPG